MMNPICGILFCLKSTNGQQHIVADSVQNVDHLVSSLADHLNCH
jgi:hypothetical protein